MQDVEFLNQSPAMPLGKQTVVLFSWPSGGGQRLNQTGCFVEDDSIELRLVWFCGQCDGQWKRFTVAYLQLLWSSTTKEKESFQQHWPQQIYQVTWFSQVQSVLEILQDVLPKMFIHFEALKMRWQLALRSMLEIAVSDWNLLGRVCVFTCQ